jgi:hypothetical protein
MLSRQYQLQMLSETLYRVALVYGTRYKFPEGILNRKQSSYLNVRDEVSDPYRTTDKIIAL